MSLLPDVEKMILTDRIAELEEQVRLQARWVTKPEIHFPSAHVVHRGKGLARLNRALGWNACIDEVKRLNGVES